MTWSLTGEIVMVVLCGRQTTVALPTLMSKHRAPDKPTMPRYRQRWRHSATSARAKPPSMWARLPRPVNISIRIP